MERVICLLIGYVFGLFQTAYFYGKAKGIDIRKYGSGNVLLPCASPEPYSVPDIRRIFICCACIPVQDPSSDTTSPFIWDLRAEKESLPLQD